PARRQHILGPPAATAALRLALTRLGLWRRCLIHGRTALTLAAADRRPAPFRRGTGHDDEKVTRWFLVRRDDLIGMPRLERDRIGRLADRREATELLARHEGAVERNFGSCFRIEGQQDQDKRQNADTPQHRNKPHRTKLPEGLDRLDSTGSTAFLRSGTS